MRARVIKWGAAVIAATLLTLGAASPANACSCGAIATPDGVTASSPESRAIVSWDGTTETIDLAIGMASDAGTIGLVLPTPSKATVSAGSESLFDLVEHTMAPVELREDDWWGRSAPAAVEPDAPAVTPLGDLVPETIRATNRKGLTSWLKDHSLHLAAEDRDLIADYASDGWSLSMIAVDASAGIDGELDPIRLSFETDELIVPMRLASTGAAATSLRLYVLGDHRVELEQSTKRVRALDVAQSVLWAGPVTARSLTARGDYLTVTDLRFDNPENQVASDIRIVDAPADDELIPSVVMYTPISLLGIPLGWLLVVWGGIGLLIGAGYLVFRFRAH